MSTYDYEVHLQILRADGLLLGQTQLEVDLMPAIEWSHFLGIRKGVLPPSMLAESRHVEPIRIREAGQPYVSGFRTVVSSATGVNAYTRDFPVTYFQSAAKKASLCFVEKGDLQMGDSFSYKVLDVKLKDPTEEEPGSSRSLSVDEVIQPLPIRSERDLNVLLTESRVMGAGEEVDMPVFMHQQLLDQIEVQTKRAGAKETGGFLVGYLHQDVGSSEIIADVTACIPADHTVSTLSSLRFTPATWAAVRSGIGEREKSEIILGWFHSHSYLQETCKDCDHAKLGTCDASALFMSADDCQLHRVAFSSPWNVALVVSDSPCSGLQYGLFGWRAGKVAQRAFNVFVTEMKTPH